MQADVNINVTANTADAEQKLRRVGTQLKGAAQGGVAAGNMAAGPAGASAPGPPPGDGEPWASRLASPPSASWPTKGCKPSPPSSGTVRAADAWAALGGTVGSVVGGPIGTAAEACRLSYSRVQRELKAGFAGILLRGKVHRRAKRANADKGRRSVATTTFANRLVEGFLKQGLSVATCLYTLRHEGWTRLPSQRTGYYHLKDGVIVLPKGRLRYRPRKTRRRSHPGAARSFQTAGASRNARQKSSPVNVLSTGRKVPSSTSMASSAFVSQRYQLLKGLPSGNHPRPEPAQRHLPEPTP